jgi:hypothetical protein
MIDKGVSQQGPILHAEPKALKGRGFGPARRMRLASR